MTDRYERIRAALADMDAAAEARNALAWRDAHARFVVHVAPDTIRELLAERDQLAAALEAARADGWQPIETAPKPDIGADGFGERLLLVVDCGDGTIPSVRRGYWEGTDWYLDCCIGLDTACGYRVTHWRPLPAPPAIDQARGKENGNVR